MFAAAWDYLLFLPLLLENLQTFKKTLKATKPKHQKPKSPKLEKSKNEHIFPETSKLRKQVPNRKKRFFSSRKTEKPPTIWSSLVSLHLLLLL